MVRTVPILLDRRDCSHDTTFPGVDVLVVCPSNALREQVNRQVPTYSSRLATHSSRMQSQILADAVALKTTSHENNRTVDGAG